MPQTLHCSQLSSVQKSCVETGLHSLPRWPCPPCQQLGPWQCSLEVHQCHARRTCAWGHGCTCWHKGHGCQWQPASEGQQMQYQTPQQQKPPFAPQFHFMYTLDVLLLLIKKINSNKQTKVCMLQPPPLHSVTSWPTSQGTSCWVGSSQLQGGHHLPPRPQVPRPSGADHPSGLPIGVGPADAAWQKWLETKVACRRTSGWAWAQVAMYTYVSKVEGPSSICIYTYTYLYIHNLYINIHM